jgi:predicted nucleic acid-binding Zn ribbon protein
VVIGRRCAVAGCPNDARRVYCSDECASRARQSRYRATTRQVDAWVIIEFGPRWLRGIDAPPEIAEIFADDAQRFARMGKRANRNARLV